MNIVKNPRLYDIKENLENVIYFQRMKNEAKG